LRAELHVLHVEEHALGAARVPRPAPRLAGLLPAELLREHAGYPPRVPPERRPPGLRGAPRARRVAVAFVRHLLRVRTVRERAGASGLGGVPQLGEVRAEAADARRAAPAAGRQAQRGAAREPGAPVARAAHAPRDRERAVVR